MSYDPFVGRRGSAASKQPSWPGSPRGVAVTGKARRTAISLATKIAIIDAVENGKVKSEVALSFELHKSSLCTILREAT